MRSAEHPGETDRLAAFATAARPFAAEVVNQAKRMILDNLACQISGAPLPWSRAYRDAAVSLGAGNGATSVYDGDALSIDEAAFLNSAYGHANEFDDTHLASATHPGSVIIPAALALAERDHRTGRELVEAVIVGSEIMIRIALAASPALHERGHYVPAAVGPFGAAAACARLLHLDARVCVNALAIAGSFSAGLKAFQQGGGSVKRIQCAIPAAAGLRSAVTAAHGITGPPAILESERGFLAVFAGTYDTAPLTDGLGEEFRMLRTAFKPVACNLSTHAAVEAAGWLQDAYGLRADDIATIEIGVSASAIGDVGVIVEPPDILAAQSSLAFGTAVRFLRGGNGPHDYHEEDLRDPRFLALAHRVTLTVDPICDNERRRLNTRPAVVTVRTTDGRSLEKRIHAPQGSPENPLANDALTRKFTAAVSPLLGAERTAELADRIWAIDALDDAGELLRLTRPAARQQNAVGAG